MTNSVDPDQTAPMSSLIWVHPVCFYTSILKLVNNVRQLFAAVDFSRRHFSEAFFLGALRVKMGLTVTDIYVLHYIMVFETV